MADADLNGMTVAILVTDGFEQVEMTEPRRALDQAGAQTLLVSPKDDRVKAWKVTDWGDEFAVDVPLAQARADDFDAILLPGGVIMGYGDQTIGPLLRRNTSLEQVSDAPACRFADGQRHDLYQRPRPKARMVDPGADRHRRGWLG